ncbi:MAG TPA: hypothetical protein VE870_06970 [Bacteroidales bacterium]|nr:hypothetical protein [Bacteroidales bacterium]
MSNLNESITEKRIDHVCFTMHLDLLNKVIAPSRHENNPLSIAIIDQLKMIYAHSERAWLRNLEQIKGEVKYLLIGESPPWSFHENATCFYSDPDSTIVDTVRKAFFRTRLEKGHELYKCLGEKGFLYIDTLPYAFPFTPEQRKSKAYGELVKSCLPRWLTKLNQSHLRLAGDLKIAFSYYWNGIQIIGASLGTLQIGNHAYPVHSDQIVAGPETRFVPSSKHLGSIFHIQPETICPD